MENTAAPNSTKPTEQQGKRGVDALITLGLRLQDSDLDRLLVIAGEAQELSTALSYDRGRAQSLMLLSRYHDRTENPAEAIDAACGALDLYESLGDTAGQVEALQLLGASYSALNNYEEALACVHRGLDLLRDSDAVLRLGLGGLQFKMQNTLSSIYSRLGRYGEALAVLLETLAQAQETGGSVLALTYSTIGECYLKNGSYDQALVYNRKALDEVKKQDLGSAQLMVCETITGMIFERSGHPQKALASYKEALNHAIAANSKYAVASMLFSIGSMQLYLKDLPGAKTSLNKALHIAWEIDADELARDIHSKLVDWFDSPDNTLERKHGKVAPGVGSDAGLQARLSNLKLIVRQGTDNLDAEIYRQVNAELKRKGEEAKGLRRELEEQARFLQQIAEIGQSIAAAAELERVLETLYTGINKQMDAAILAIGTLNESSRQFEYTLVMENGKQLPAMKSPASSEILKAIRSGRDALFNDIKPADVGRFALRTGNPSGKPPRSALYIPLMPSNKRLGVLTVQSYNSEAYESSDKRMLRVMAQYIAIAMNNAQKTAELRAKELELAQAVRTDQLTGLYNRRDMIERMEEECVRSQRSKKRFSLVLAEVDQLKSLRDSQGQDYFDHMMKLAARLLRSSLRKQDFLGRWSDDQFVILLPETEAAGAVLLCEKLRKKIVKQAFAYEQLEISATMTCGLTDYNNSKKIGRAHV
jgi:diguanylate cyclase (GGDEF)-like protein